MKDEDIARTLSAAVRRARSALGLSQASMAERIHVSVEFYARIERGAAKPSVETFARMVAALDVSADDLLGIDTRGPPEPAPLTRPDDAPELCELVPRLLEAQRTTLRLVRSILNEIDRAKKRPRGSRGTPAGSSSGGG